VTNESVNLEEVIMKVMVTGAGGMVGSHMVELLYEQGHEVLGTYYKPTTNMAELDPAIKMVECDVRYHQAVQRIIMEFQPEQICHLAAQSYPTVSWAHPQATMDTNINGTVNVYEAIKDVRKLNPEYDPIVVVACSSAEYGQTLNELENPYVKETAELKPLHPYGVSKVGQDLLSFQYFMNDHIRCIRVRIFNSTGTRKVNDVTSDFTKRAVLAERSGVYELRVGNLETRRAIMDQRDLVNGLMLLAEKGKAGEAYNLSSERCYQMKDIVTMIEEQIGHKFKIKVDRKLLRPTDEPIIIGNVDKLKRDTGWSQKIEMQQTIADMLNYWRKVL
jgi:GDP-4-dehydro-6-deoxy-D-mannose reductase